MMIRTAQFPSFVVGGKPNNDLVYQGDFPHRSDFHIQTISCNFAPEAIRASDIRHIASLKQKKEDSIKTKQTKSILKNSYDAQMRTDALPVPEHQKLDITQIHCMLKKRKTFSHENVAKNRSSEKNEKKVKFDDKLNRLEELSTKYKAEPEKKVSNSESTCIRHQRRQDKLTLRNTEKRESKESLVHISTVYDLKEKRPMSPHSQTKSSSSGSLQVQSDRKSSLTSIQNNQGNEEFVHMDFHEQTPVPTYNTRFSNYYESRDNRNEEKVKMNEAEEKLIQKGIPAFSKAGRYIRPSEVVNESKSKQLPDTEPSIKPSYRLPGDVKYKRKDMDTVLHVTSGQRNLVTKTTTNTCGGATVTRSHVRPFMFTRLAQEPEPVHLVPIDQNKNYCDEGKTSQIMRWLKHVSDIQAREGFCTLIHDVD